MTSYLIDINVWLALTWDRRAQHAAAARWYSSIDDAALLFCRFTMLGFLRLPTNRQVMGDSTATLIRRAGDIRPLETGSPRGTCGRVASHGSSFPGGRSASFEPAGDEGSSRLLPRRIRRGAAARIVTFDAGLAATARFRDVPVTLLEPVGPAVKGHPRRL